VKEVHEPGRIYDAAEMAEVYAAVPEKWLLLEVLERDENGRAQKLKLIRYAATKEELQDYLINEAEDWDWNTNYIFVYSDPNQQCELY